jgi:hypothetical protein
MDLLQEEGGRPVAGVLRQDEALHAVHVVVYVPQGLQLDSLPGALELVDPVRVDGLVLQVQPSAIPGHGEIYIPHSLFILLHIEAEVVVMVGHDEHTVYDDREQIFLPEADEEQATCNMIRWT